MPSRRSSLFATWLYSDIASNPSVSPSLRIVSDSIPCSSARSTAAARIRSRLSGTRGSVVTAIDRSYAVRLGLRHKLTTYGGADDDGDSDQAGDRDHDEDGRPRQV